MPEQKNSPINASIYEGVDGSGCWTRTSDPLINSYFNNTRYD